MVLQRDIPIHVWGHAAEGEAVTASFRGSSATTTASDIGRWSLWLPAAGAGGPFELVVRGASNTIRLGDVLVGDVWVASGQSNMGFTLNKARNAEAELAAANHPRIRLVRVKTATSAYPLDDAALQHPWSVCTAQSAADFSAVAYFFGRDLERKLGVPIGLIDASWGGTPAEAWTSLGALASDASLMPVFAQWARRNEDALTIRARRQKELAAYEQAAARARSQGNPLPPFPWRDNDRGEWEPAALFNAMIAPITSVPIRGVIWYQGESNATAERVPLYTRLFSTLIQDWRRAWAQGGFPFLFVQLANFRTPPEARWPELRQAQFETLAVANTAMAVASDIGESNDTHPRNKQEVGRRLALAALALSYGEKLEYSGPLFRQAVREGSALRLRFDHTAGGLLARGGKLNGFELAAADGAFVPAAARIDGETVMVSAPSVAAPERVRYAWRDDPDGNLVNGAGLPASPFRTPKD
jgi:sialate O-acetylesterase